MKIRFASLLTFLLLVNQSCTNVLSQTAKVTDDSLLVSAQTSMNDKDYTSAIADFKLMSTAYLTQRSVTALYASAYGGRCGLDFIGLVNAFSNIGTSTVLDVLYKTAIKATPSQEADCVTAETLMMSLGATSASRTVAENLLLGLIEFQRIGVILAQYADQAATGNIDAGFDPCQTSKGSLPGATGLPVPEAQNLSASLMIGFDALSSSGISAFSSSASSFQSYCTTVETYTGGTNPCTQTAPTSFTNNELRALMGLVKTNFFGIGNCSDTSLATCVCTVYP